MRVTAQRGTAPSPLAPHVTSYWVCAVDSLDRPTPRLTSRNGGPDGSQSGTRGSFRLEPYPRESLRRLRRRGRLDYRFVWWGSRLASRSASVGPRRGDRIENAAVAQMDKVTHANAGNSEESSSASMAPSGQRQGLADMVGGFRLDRGHRSKEFP